MRVDGNDIAGWLFIICGALVAGSCIYADAKDDEREDQLRARCIELRGNWDRGSCIAERR